MEHNKFFEDMTKLFSSTLNAAIDARKTAEDSIRHSAARTMETFGFVKREEIDSVRDMALKARKENEVLKAKVAELEKKLGGSGKASAPAPAQTQAASASAPRTENPKAAKSAAKPIKAAKSAEKAAAPSSQPSKLSAVPSPSLPIAAALQSLSLGQKPIVTQSAIAQSAQAGAPSSAKPGTTPTKKA